VRAHVRFANGADRRDLPLGMALVGSDDTAPRLSAIVSDGKWDPTFDPGTDDSVAITAELEGADPIFEALGARHLVLAPVRDRLELQGRRAGAQLFIDAPSIVPGDQVEVRVRLAGDHVDARPLTYEVTSGPGTLDRTSGTSDANGEALFVYTAPSAGGGAVRVGAGFNDFEVLVPPPELRITVRAPTTTSTSRTTSTSTSTTTTTLPPPPAVRVTVSKQTGVPIDFVTATAGSGCGMTTSNVPLGTGHVTTTSWNGNAPPVCPGVSYGFPEGPLVVTFDVTCSDGRAASGSCTFDVGANCSITSPVTCTCGGDCVIRVNVTP
jgi:hypothetical protein